MPRHNTRPDIVIGAKRQPRNEMTGIGPECHIPTDFTEQRQSVALQAGDLGNIHAE
jgi:hypothetical protein